jgi:hypothetical protein
MTEQELSDQITTGYQVALQRFDGERRPSSASIVEDAVFINDLETYREWKGRWSAVSAKLPLHFDSASLLALRKKYELLADQLQNNVRSSRTEIDFNAPVERAFDQAQTKRGELETSDTQSRLTSGRDVVGQGGLGEDQPIPDRIPWNGTVKQLAYLLAKLQDSGLIGTTEIWAAGSGHFVASDGTSIKRETLKQAGLEIRQGLRPGRDGRDADPIDEIVEGLEDSALGEPSN